MSDLLISQVSDLLMTEAICSYSRGGEVGGRGEVVRMIIIGYDDVLMIVFMMTVIIMMILMTRRIGEER